MSKSSPKTLNLNEFLPYCLSIVTNKVSSSFADLYSEKFNLTIPEWRIMAVLGQHPDLSADEVCIKTEMDKVTVSRAVTKLLKKKHIVREFSKEDKRRSILELSISGFAIYSQVVPIAHKFETQLVGALSDKELQNLKVLLGKLERQSDKLDELLQEG